MTAKLQHEIYMGGFTGQPHLRIPGG